MSSSLIPGVLTALVSNLTTALAPLEVRDGPPTTDVPASGLYVGATDSDNAIPYTQDWATYGASRRNETFEIPNLLFVRSGDNDMAAARTSVFGYVATVENYLRANANLGMPTNSIRAQFGTSGEFTQVQSPDGVVVRVMFTIKVEGRI